MRIIDRRACLAVAGVAALVAGCGGGSSKPSASVVNTVCPKAARTVKALKTQLTSFKRDVNASRYASLVVDSRAVAGSVNQLATDINKLGYADFASKIRTFASDLMQLGRDAGKLKISALGSDAQTLQAADDALKKAKAPSEHVCKAFKNLAALGG